MPDNRYQVGCGDHFGLYIFKGNTSSEIPPVV
jgi:hypothetical protein